MELPQRTISRIVFRVTLILASYLNTYVKFVTNPAAIQENRRLFKELGFGYGAIGLPSIDGAIVCGIAPHIEHRNIPDRISGKEE